MSEIVIGGKTSGQYEDIDFSQPAAAEPAEPATPQNPSEPTEPTEPVEPTNEPAAPQEPAEPTQQQNRSSLSYTPSTPDNNAPVAVSDDVLLKTLSEKLGKDIKDFSELTPTQSNPLDADPYLKSLVEWREKTGRPIEDWVKYQKDYDSMPDLNIARELLQYKYPTLTNEEIEIEMLKYIPEEFEDDSDKAFKRLELKKVAMEGRQTLSQLKSSLNDPTPTKYSPEVQEDLKLAQDVKQYLQAEEVNKITYQKNVNDISTKLDSFKIPLSGDLVLDYKISEQSRKEIPALIDTMPHWKNEDGSTNFEAVVTDAVKIKHFDDIIRVVYEQAFNSGKEALIKETNNINFTEPVPAGVNLPRTQGVVIEGLDTYKGDRGMRINTRN